MVDGRLFHFIFSSISLIRFTIAPRSDRECLVCICSSFIISFIIYAYARKAHRNTQWIIFEEIPFHVTLLHASTDMEISIGWSLMSFALEINFIDFRICVRSASSLVSVFLWKSVLTKYNKVPQLISFSKVINLYSWLFSKFSFNY